MADGKRYRVLVSEQGKDGKTYYTQIGTAFPLREKDGFSIKLKAHPIGGEMVMFPDEPKDDRGPQRPRRELGEDW